MPKYSVMITRTQTIESTTEVEVTAKDEEAACAKAEEKISKATASEKGVEAKFDWEECSNSDDFEYEASEG